MKKLKTSIIGCAVLVAATSTSFAQTFSFAEATAGWANACGNDVARHCKVVKTNGDELVLCLTQYASPSCRAATDKFVENRNARLTAQAGAPKHCKADAKRLCSGFKEGQGRILKCLMRGNHYKQMTKNCRSWLRSAGWLDRITQ